MKTNHFFIFHLKKLTIKVILIQWNYQTDLESQYFKTELIIKANFKTVKLMMMKQSLYSQMEDITKEKWKIQQWMDKVYSHTKMFILLKVLGKMDILKVKVSKSTINKIQLILEGSIQVLRKVPVLICGITEEASTTANLVKVWCMISLEEFRPKVA